MSELRIPGATRASGPSVMEVARDREDVVVGDEIVRHRLSSRVVHWDGRGLSSGRSSPACPSGRPCSAGWRTSSAALGVPLVARLAGGRVSRPRHW